MLVSLFTDASHCPHTKVGGWGAWAKCELGKIEGGGPMKREIANSTVAEARAVYAGLILISKAPWWEHIERVLIQSDAKSVIDHLNSLTPVSKYANTWHNDLITAVSGFSNLHGVIITGRWVKGHQSSGKATRNWVNNRTDKLAKKGLEEARRWYSRDHKGEDVTK
jgi:ribonuclease HI